MWLLICHCYISFISDAAFLCRFLYLINHQRWTSVWGTWALHSFHLNILFHYYWAYIISESKVKSKCIVLLDQKKKITTNIPFIVREARSLFSKCRKCSRSDSHFLFLTYLHQSWRITSFVWSVFRCLSTCPWGILGNALPVLFMQWN